MLANSITLLRVLLTFVVIALFQRNVYVDMMILGTIALIFALDAVDGYIARKQNQTSDVGAMLDVVGDRIIENSFWFYFAFHRMIPLWMPIVVLSRGILTDNVKRFATHQKKTTLAANTGTLSTWTRYLTNSRVSRGIYGCAKAVTFLYLGSVMLLKQANFQVGCIHHLERPGVVLSIVTVAMCLIRGLPVVVDGWHSLNRNQI